MAPKQIAIRTANAVARIKQAALQIAELTGVEPPDLDSITRQGGADVVRMKELEVMAEWLDELSVPSRSRKRKPRPVGAAEEPNGSTQGNEAQDQNDQEPPEAPPAGGSGDALIPLQDEGDTAPVVAGSEGPQPGDIQPPATVPSGQLPPAVIDDAAPGI